MNSSLMRLAAFSLLLFVCQSIVAQQPVKELYPIEIQTLDLSPEGDAQFKKDRELYNKISEKLNRGIKIEQLTENEKRVLNETNETMEDYWDIIGGGCSWYCGGGPQSVIASSELKAQGSNIYIAKNAHDLSYKNAWVEGATGYGIGEFLLYKFAPESPRITDIIIVNGYVKSHRAYLDNSRVKKLKMYINDIPYAILNLEDQRSQQRFTVEPIGNGNRENIDKLKTLPGWTLKFEILDAYKGLKYDDTVITEIFFSGLDVH
jgi:hypothetical protein